MDDYTEDSSPELESNDSLMNGSKDEELAPDPEAPEEVSGEPAPEPEAPEEEPVEPEPEMPPAEETGDGSGTVQDLIDAIGDLNETITGAVTQEPEELPVEEEGSNPGGGPSGEVFVEEPANVDLTPVVRELERTNELLEQQGEALVVQHNDLLQLQANVDFVFLAVAALIGVVLGAAIGLVLDRMWRT